MKQIAVIGCGMGNESQLTADARNALDSAEYIIGSARLVQELAANEKESCIAVTVEQVQKHIEETKADKIAILVSGDTGFFSAAKGYRAIQGAEIIFYPGISSVQAFCSKLQLNWEQMRLISLHGRNCNLVQEVGSHEWVFCLTGNNLMEIGDKLCEYGYENLEIYVGENLSMKTERIYHGIAQDLLKQSFGPMTVVLLHNPNYQNRHPIGIPDDAFIRGNVPMTKQEIRTLVIGKLGLATNAVSWDIGGGTGSVSVEMALQSRQGKVYSVECNPEALDLMKKNRRRFRADAMEIVEGFAPEVLVDLPAPDAVFLGGTKGNAEEIIHLVLEKNPKARVVATAVSLETVAQMTALFRECFDNAEILQVQVSIADFKGNHTLMHGQNPIFIFCGGGTPWHVS